MHKSKRRITTESDEEDHYGSSSYQHRQQSDDDEFDPPPRPKRQRTVERSVSSDAMNIATEFEGELDVEAVSEDATFAPEPGPSSIPEPPQPVRRNSRNVRKPDYRALAGVSEGGRRRSVSSSVPATTTTTAPKAKRAAVVYSDDENEEYEGQQRSDRHARGRSGDDDDDEDDFEVEHTMRRSASKKGKSGGAAKGVKGKAKSEEKEIFVRDERKIVPPVPRSPSPSIQATKRPLADEDDQGAIDVPGNDKPDAEKSALPAFKKRKLPTIKKNKPPGAGTNGSTGPSTPVTRPALEKTAETERLPLPVVRKNAVAAPNADFDLRDASVYASLFQKPGGITPNSGLNRKEKEEERRKELNKMRDEARAKRLQEAKNTFNLQATHDKISRFEERLHARKSMAIFPNILGAAFKDIYERKKRAAASEGQRERR
ncbi:hypothetical protein BXZ70DRAFT_252926 [Cristinia sonorae]|uniref:Uncharacterized protein n=1 Tax=Cristinia sonorae TaxID=1940300 RepID=A0A8K0UZH7_9AGAR|nr:hypothetical protein BXZ70DRAFT_252926 [Cristinia sonorae]